MSVPIDARRAAWCLDRIGEIAAALREAIAETSAEDVRGRACADADCALALAYAARAGLEAAENRAAAAAYLDRAIEAVGEVAMPPWLFGGFTQVAWTVEHLRDELFDVDSDDVTGDGGGDDDDPLADIDEVLLDHLDGEPGGEYDLISGLVGLAVYGFERLARGRGAEIVARVVRLLAARAEEVDEGVVWHTPPALLPAHQRAEEPDGYYNFGTAHGMPGILHVLAHAARGGIASELAGALAGRGAAALLACAQPAASGSRFPAWRARLDAPPSACRAAWCYGDPGLAGALHVVGSLLEAPALRAAARDIAADALARSPEQAVVVDAALCHGASGLALIARELARDPAAARDFPGLTARWLDVLETFHRPGEGIGGFVGRLPTPDGSIVEQPDRSLLNGSSGIALALLAIATPVPPEWTRLLLLR